MRSCEKTASSPDDRNALSRMRFLSTDLDFVKGLVNGWSGVVDLHEKHSLPHKAAAVSQHLIRINTLAY